MGKRIVFLDYMRVIACFMVIMVHSCEFFFIDGDSIGIRNLNDGFWVSLIDSAFRCSVPLFVMISAYLLVPLKESAALFFKRRLTRVVIPFAVWSLLYAALPYLWGGAELSEVGASLLRLTYNFNAASGHMWFIYMLIGLYLFMPVISPWLEKAGRRGEEAFLCLWFLSSFFPYLRSVVGDVYGECYWNEFNMLWYFSGFLGYVVLAHYTKHYAEWSTKRSIIAGSLLYLLGYYFTATIWYDRIPTAETLRELELSWRFCTPNVIAMSFGAFIIIRALFSRQIDGYKIVKEISVLSYGVYLMHIFILGAVYSVVAGFLPTQWTILTVGTITFVVCCVLAKLISFLPFSRYIIG